jgi:hypothetical protein
MMKPGLGRWPIMAMCALLLAAALTMAALAADPGSKEDPLATVSYVQQRGMFTLQQFRAGTSIRLGTGAELVVTQPVSGQVLIEEFDPLRDELLDLSEGALVSQKVMFPAHHYVNGSGHDIFLRPQSDVSLLVRGEWK